MLTKKNLWFLLVVVFLLKMGNVFAQFKYFEKMSTTEGDVNLSVRHILQDKQGFIWLATFSGLYVYQGDEYILKHEFGRENSINEDVTALLQDHESNIWIGTNDGLSKYNPEFETLTTYRSASGNPHSIGSNKIRSLALNSNGQVFVGTNDKGLFVYDASRDAFIPVVFDKKTNTNPLYVKTIYIDEEDKIWLGTLENGLYVISYVDDKVESVINYRMENQKHSLSNNYVYTIYRDNDGTIAVGTRNGLNVFDRDKQCFVDVTSGTFLPGSLTNFFRTVWRDTSGKLWIGSWGGLILCDSFSDLESGNYQLIKHNRNVANSISHNQVMDVFQDRSGVIWIATENGLNRYDPYLNQFDPLSGDVIDQLSEPTVTCFSPYKNGVLMLTIADGLLFKDGNKIEAFYTKQITAFEEEKFYALYVDSSEHVWMGSRSGLLVKFDVNGKPIKIYKHSKDNVPINSIIEVNDHTLAIGTYGQGLKYLNTRTGKFNLERGLSDPVQIMDLHLDAQKRLWVATQFGVFKKEAGKTTFNYYLPDNPDSILNPNIFLDIAEADNGNMYFGGRNGLYVYDESLNLLQKQSLDTKEKLWITNLQFDSKQNLWMNLNFNRLAEWDRSANRFFTYDINNGIRSSVYNQRGFYINEQDHIFISGFDQIFEFKANESVKNTYSPTPVFTRLLVNNTPIFAGVKLNDQVILKRNIAFEDKIKLNHLNKDFTLSFNSQSFINTKKNRFRYFLHGYDQTWHEGATQEASYTNLSPGKYVFEVFSANNDGVWSEDSARIQLKVLPAPLLSPLAFAIYIILLIGIALTVYRVLKTRLQLKSELLVEKVKRDKEEKFNEERLRFYTNISHELRTPLTLIIGPVKELIDGTKSQAESTHFHQLIYNNAQRLLSLVNQLLDFRKSLHQGMKLKVTNIDLNKVVVSNLEAFGYMAEQKHISVDYQPGDAELMAWLDLEKVNIILFNLLSNAFKYTPENGNVRLEVGSEYANDRLKTQHVVVKITNTGKGISKQFQEKVFRRFYQVEDTKSNVVNTGTGIGLALVKNVVELHHGAIYLDSTPGSSTTFTVVLPKNIDDYSEEEIFDFKRDADRHTKELLQNVNKQTDDSVFEKTDEESEKILIVEDNSELRDYLKKYLQRYYKVYTARNGAEGLDVCRVKYPDLVISDILMDEMDGMDFCTSIKSTPEISHIPVILMTAIATLEKKMEGYKIGADDFISKPIEPELLLIRIRNILDNRTRLKAEFLNSEDVTPKELTISKIDEDFLNKVIDLVNDNLDNADFDIDSFSRHLGVSSSQLYRKIKGITDLSPNEFIRSYRLRKAAKMITESVLSVSEIAYRVGFNDPRYFSKCFKKHYGVSPSQYSRD